jgi:hypothetical protein
VSPEEFNGSMLTSKLTFNDHGRIRSFWKSGIKRCGDLANLFGWRRKYFDPPGPSDEGCISRNTWTKTIINAMPRYPIVYQLE